MLSARMSLGEEKSISGLANLMGQCSIDHTLIMPELYSTDTPSFSCRLFPYVQRLPSSIPNIKAPSGSTHIAILVPIKVFPNLIVDGKLSICVYKRLCEAQHR